MNENVTTYEPTDTSNQTPIEIALGVDNEGRTTARKLYAFLELESTHYTRWYKANIINNEFAEEGIDYEVLAIDGENPLGGRPSQDFKLSAKFAKKLSMKGNGEKAEAARDYFIKIEEDKKQEVIDKRKLSPQTQLMNLLVENISKQELEQKRQAEQLKTLEQKTEKVEESIQTVADTFVKEGTEEEFRTWVNKSLNRIAQSPNYTFIGDKYQGARKESYERLTNEAHCRLAILVQNATKRAEEKGATKSQLKSINKLSVIMADVRLKKIYHSVIREMLLAYCLDYKE